MPLRATLFYFTTGTHLKKSRIQTNHQPQMLDALPPSCPSAFPFTHPTIYAHDACCFHCSLRALKHKVATLLAKLPPGAWERHAKPLIVLPLLRRLSLIDPLRRMPLRWLERAEAVPAQCPAGACPVVVRYWDLCRMLWAGPEKEGDALFFDAMHALASYALFSITRGGEGQPVPREDESLGLQKRIVMLAGADPIAEEMHRFMAGTLIAQQPPVDVGHLVRVIRCTEAQEYALFLIDRAHSSFAAGDVRQAALQGLRDAVLDTLRAETAKLRALCMALHPRSTGAQVRVLGLDLLRVCAGHAGRGRLVTWEEALVGWLGA